jgi:hypothetical protein
VSAITVHPEDITMEEPGVPTAQLQLRDRATIFVTAATMLLLQETEIMPIT